MKLRQKLAAALAASMVVTAVPVVTMAESTNSISVYNYNIKNTTVGFQTTSTVLHADATTSAGIQIYTGNGSTRGFNATLVPGVEIKPESTYVLGGSATAPSQTVFLHLTEDSNFEEDALLFYADALNSPNQTSTMYIKEDGTIAGSHSGWDTKTKKEVLAAGVKIETPNTTSSRASLTDPA